MFYLLNLRIIQGNVQVIYDSLLEIACINE